MSIDWIEGVGKVTGLRPIADRIFGALENRIAEETVRRGTPICFMPEEVYQAVMEAVEGKRILVKDVDGEKKYFFMARNRIVTAKVEDDIKEFIQRAVIKGYARSESEVVRIALRLLMVLTSKLEED